MHPSPSSRPARASVVSRAAHTARHLGLALVIGGALAAGGLPAGADDGYDEPPSGAAAAATTKPAFGVYYERYEPTFYTGFAPRTFEPSRIHLHIGRGNQLRATVVLSDEALGVYARDLHARYRTLRGLIDSGELRLTQNTAFEEMEATQQAIGLERLVVEEKTLSPEALRARNLDLVERLNPDRVFRIRMPLREVVSRWMATAAAEPDGRLDADARVALLDAMLPTRLFFERKDVDAATAAELDALVAQARRLAATPGPAAVAELKPGFVRLFERVTNGRYPVRGDALEFAEFTAVYPVGTANEFTKHEGRQIPLYPTPGRRQLMTHQRSNTIDHIATVPTYSYSPWIPYMHVGSNMHNAFHTPYWELAPARAAFLPDELRTTPGRSRDGKPYPFAYLLSRGPASHGCTHVNPGHLVELRQILPSETDRLDEVEVFLNKSHLYDVFDIDGDLSPEVMGVGYFVAYSIRNDKPGSMYAPVDRKGFYDWLYAGDLRIDAAGRGTFENVRDGAFAGDSATEGRSYAKLPLYEARYEPERIQFYASRPIPFVRELRKVGAQHPFSAERARAREKERQL